MDITNSPPSAGVGLSGSNQSDTDEYRLAMLEYLRTVRRNMWAILAFATVVAVVALAISLTLTPTYRSTVSLMLEEGKSNVVRIDDVMAVSKNREYFSTQVEIMKSRDVAQRTINRLKLWEAPEFDARRISKTDFSKFGLSEEWMDRLGVSAPKKEWTDAELAQAAINPFMRRLTVQPGRLNLMVGISFDSADPELAAKVVNVHAEQYIYADRDAKMSASQQVNNWLQDRLEGLREKLVGSERALQSYRERNGIVEMSGSVQQFAGQQISDVTQKLVEARVRRAEFESTYQQIKSVKDGDYSSIPLVMRNPQVAEAKTREATAKAVVSQMAGRYGAEHPKMVAAQGDLAAAHDYLKRQSELAVSGVSREYEAASATVAALEKALGSARGLLQNVNRSSTDQQVLERDVATNKQLYELFLARSKETNNTVDIQTAVARIIDRGVTGAKVAPKVMQMVAIALVLGLVAGAVIAVLKENLDSTIKTTDAAEHKLKQPLLSTLPLMDIKDRKNTARIYLEKQESHFAEAVRTARTGILLSNLDERCKVLMCTSSVPGEGKTTVASNLALALAQTQKTLLIDADMRRPQVAKSFELAPGLAGLSNLVACTDDESRCIHSMPDTKLHVMPAGAIPPNPLELLVSVSFKRILESLKEHYEVIIIDTPPVELVSDALVLAPMVNSVLFVTKANSTPAPMARKALQRLQRAGGRMLGVILNQLDFHDAGRYYGEYSFYSKYGKNQYESYGYSGPYGQRKSRTEKAPDPV